MGRSTPALLLLLLAAAVLLLDPRPGVLAFVVVPAPPTLHHRQLPSCSRLPQHQHQQPWRGRLLVSLAQKPQQQQQQQQQQQLVPPGEGAASSSSAVGALVQSHMAVLRALCPAVTGWV